MSKVHIELDLKVVQEAIHAKVRPAVDAILAKVDLPAIIKAKLLEKPAKGKEDSYGGLSALMMMRYSGYGDAGSTEPLINSLVHSEIQEAATKFVKGAVKKERPALEKAFKRMLASNPDKLAQTLLDSLNGALESDWSFTLDTKIAPKEPDRSSYD